MDADTKKCLYKYVHDFEKRDECVKRILPVIMAQPGRELIVYRGQGNTPRIDRARIQGFLSTSKRAYAAKEGFSGKQCCLFKIHVESDVPSLDVYQFIEKKSMAEEEEVLLPEGGYFYKDRTLTTEGFTQTKSGEYETWYTMRPPASSMPPATPPNDMTAERILGIIGPGEYFLINSPEDIEFDVSDEIKAAVFEEIKKRKGGKRRK